ncbi:hypothetical protein GCM10027347_51680 [Larkinella harenae]
MIIRLLLLVSSLLAPAWCQAQQDLLPDSLHHAPDSVKTWTLREMGDSLIFEGQLTTAKLAIDQALSIARATQNPADIGFCYRSTGYWYSNVGDYGQAISWYQKALQQFQQAGRTKQFTKTLTYISFCYSRLKDDSHTLYYLKKGIALAQQEGYTDLLITFYDGMANYKDQHKQYKEAIEYHQKVLEYRKSKKEWNEYYGGLYNLGLLYKNMKAYRRSEQAFRETLAFAQENHDAYLGGYALVSIPYALIPQGKLQEAEAFCRQALDWVNKTGTEKHSLQTEVYGHLSQIWEKRGDYRQALHYYRQQVTTKDSVLNTTRSRQVAELEARYQTREKEEHIRQLAEINAQQTRQIWVGSGGVILLLILLGTLYHLYQRIRQSRQKIQQQSEQLTLMMRELHHRVKNNLAIVSSLLSLQATRLNDENAIEAIRVGQQRVEAMSFIHQRLYLTDQVTTVNMHDYLLDLTQSLIKAYGYQPSEFDLQLDIQLAELDVDLATPIGLVANELISNSFKHAFQKTPRPQLGIKLLAGDQSPHSCLTLEIRDNGPGIESANWHQVDRKSSFGKQLIVMLTEQMEGKLELLQQNGTLFRLSIPQTRLSV